MKVLITGGTGLVGQHLARFLADKKIDYAFLTRSPKKNFHFKWDVSSEFIDPKAFDGVTHLVHLAGASVAEKRWTTKRKKELYDSRIDSTNLLYQHIKKQNIKLDAYIGASAIGFYGTSDQEKFDEGSNAGNDFLAKITADWEKAHKKLEDLVDRTCIIRIGIVLSMNGGALEQIVKPIKLLVGAPLGNGRQYMSWVHQEDLIRIIDQSLFNDAYSGIYNATAPEPVQNKKLTKVIAKKVSRPLWAPNVPKFALELLLGEFGSSLCESTYVKNKRLTETGFRFKFEKIETAIDDLL